ncbi:hypothetical protein HGA02_15895, partial [Cellulomonas septica]|nr:hypothetical protein [Cellulomonas septica]
MTSPQDDAPRPPAWAAPPPAVKVPAHKRRWFWPTVVGVVAFVLGAIAGGGGEAPTP